MNVVGVAPCQCHSPGGGDDDVAGSQAQRRAAAGLDETLAHGDVEGLTEVVAVPGGVGAGREVHSSERERGWTLVGGDGVDVDVAAEPVGRAFGGGAFGYAFHGRSLS
jgi:hypothetical protein